MTSIAQQSTQRSRYTLYGVLYHHDVSASGGHYTVDVLHPNGHGSSGEAWLRIDDETVSAVRDEDVLGPYEDKQVEDRCPYMLFYCRTALTGTL